VTTVPEVLTALASLGVTTLPGSQVINGDLTSVTNVKGRLLLIGDQDFDVAREFDSLAGVTTTEHYVVPCGAVADLPTPDQSVADAQAWADYEAMEVAIANNPSLGLSGSFSLQAAIVGTQTFRRLANSDGRQSLVRFGVDVFATSN
jgi:hypothetical protein